MAAPAHVTGFIFQSRASAASAVIHLERLMQEGKVVSIRGDAVDRPAAEVDEDLVSKLTEMLEMAKAGRIVSVAACYVQDTGEACTVFQITRERFAISHALSALHWRLHQHMDAEARGE